MRQLVVQLAMAAVAVVLVTSVAAQDTDGDGLLDLIDVPGFDPNQTGRGYYNSLGIQDLDGANLLVNLESLSLSNNEITSIESGDFYGLTNLVSLFLSNNPITSIENGDFHGLTSLAWLSLHSGQITSIESGDFDGLTNLQRLDLGGNDITSIERGDFDELTSLHTLWLSRNQIASIANGDFVGLASLQVLTLDGNELASIEIGDFEGLASLVALSLYGNEIASIDGGAFSGLANLRGLYLHSNQIASFESGVFNGLNSLRHLLLGGNPLHELNLAGATFSELEPCDYGPFGSFGFCLLENDITSLILDSAAISVGSFEAILSETRSITDASLIRLRFVEANPDNLTQLLGIATLDNVTVDRFLFDLYADEFNAFDALPGNTVTVVPEPGGVVLAVLLFGLLCRRPYFHRAVTR